MVFAWLRPALPMALALCWTAPAQTQELCRAFAEPLGKSSPTVDQKGRPWVRPAQTLTSRPDSVVHLDPGKDMKVSEAESALAGEFHASPSLVKAVRDLAGVSGYLRLHRFGNSALYAASENGGSANCQSFVFFEVTDGKADLVDDPPIIVNGRNGVLLFCTGFGVETSVGEIRGQPALIVEIGKDQDEEIRITPWRDHSWQKECQVNIHFGADFTVAEQQCQGVDCAVVAGRARALAMQYDKDPGSLEQLPKPDEKYQRWLAGPVELPTFGKPSQAQQGFGEESVALSVVLGGATYIARLGHGAIGWRKYPDYLLALYRPRGDELEPVAGILVAKTRGKPEQVTVK